MIIFPGPLPTPTAACPLAADDVIAVAPVHFAHLSTDFDGLSSGTWSSGPGHFNYTYWTDEVIYILDGSAMIKDHADPFRIWNHVGPGDVVHFTAGATAEWKTNGVRKLWVMRRPSLVRRFKLRVRKFLFKLWPPISVRQMERT
jgi:uncharacterized cupin superfamily protein